MRKTLSRWKVMVGVGIVLLWDILLSVMCLSQDYGHTPLPIVITIKFFRYLLKPNYFLERLFNLTELVKTFNL